MDITIVRLHEFLSKKFSGARDVYLNIGKNFLGEEKLMLKVTWNEGKDSEHIRNYEIDIRMVDEVIRDKNEGDNNEQCNILKT